MNKSEVYEWIKAIVIAVIIAIIIKAFVFDTTYVKGYSMYSTLHEGDRLFTNKIGYQFNSPKREDIVIFKAPDDPSKDYIKRVIGISGDTVEIREGRVFLNGNILNENYLGDKSYTDSYVENKWTVPKGHIFVLGDNRGKGASKDSRYFGFVNEDLIKGKAFFRYFPFDNRFGTLH